MRHGIAGLLILSSALGLASLASADAPDMINYQGRLLESGVPVNGARRVLIEFCPNSTGVGCVGMGAAQDVGVANGIFRTTFTVNPGIQLVDGSHWLRVNVGPAGGPVTPMNPLEKVTSAPYALYATSATTLVQSPGAPGIQISTNVGIGVMGAEAPLHVLRQTGFARAIIQSNGVGGGAAVELRATGTNGVAVLELNRADANGSSRVDFKQAGQTVWQAAFANGASGNRLQLGQPGLNAISVSPGARVGVGIDGALAQLHVSSAAADGPLLRVDIGAGTPSLFVGGDGGVGIGTGAPAGTGLRLDVAGRLLVGGGSGGTSSLSINGGLRASGLIELVGTSSIQVVGVGSIIAGSGGIISTQTTSTFAGIAATNGVFSGQVQVSTIAVVSHIVATGGAPTLGCGGSGATLGGSDVAGRITLGASGAAPCTVTFAMGYGAAPVCMANVDSGPGSASASTTATALTVSGAGWSSTTIVSYMCIGM